MWHWLLGIESVNEIFALDDILGSVILILVKHRAKPLCC